MALEALQAEIALLISQMESQPEDRQELHQMLIEKLNEMRAYGLPLPQDLLDLEAALDAELRSHPASSRP